MKSTATTVDEYLNELPDARRDALSSLRKTILENLPAGYVEVINWGMITYEVPLADCPKTYNGKPLMYLALASQKNHMALYLCSLYCQPELKQELVEAYKDAKLKLDMGASCLRFKTLKNLHMPAIIKAISATSMADFIAQSKYGGKQ